jgi:hypothetical protein
MAVGCARVRRQDDGPRRDRIPTDPRQLEFSLPDHLHPLDSR